MRPLEKMLLNERRDLLLDASMDALDYLRGCFHVDNINAFYEVRPEAELQSSINTILIGCTYYMIINDRDPLLKH